MSVIYKNGKWYGKGGGGGASDLGGLTDVTLTTPANGEVLKYDGSQWVNAEEEHDSTKADAVSVAPAFNATATYAIGDRVTYEGRLYEFTAAHTGAWVAADVSETDVAEITEPLSAAEMQEVKDAFLASQVVPFATTMDVIDLRGNERVVGKVIKADGTETPLYEQTIATDGLSMPAKGSSLYVDLSTDATKNLIDCFGYLKYTFNSVDYKIIINGYQMADAASSLAVYSAVLQYSGKIRVKISQGMTSSTVPCDLLATIRYTKS